MYSFGDLAAPICPDSIDAPRKEFFTFEGSAHSPILEEPKRFVEVIRSVLKK